MSLYNVYDNVIDTTMSFDEYVKFAGIEVGSDYYNELKAAYEAHDVTQFNSLVDYNDVKKYLENARNRDDLSNVIDAINKKYSSKGAQDAINDWFAEQDIVSITSTSGEVVEFYVNRSGLPPENSIQPSGGSYSGGVGLNTALSASINSDGQLVVSDTLKTASGEPVQAYVGTIASSIAGLATAAAFAKDVRGAIYTKAKSFWGLDLYQFDPVWWDNAYPANKLTGFKAFVAKNLLSINPTTNDITMYVDEDFVSGVAAYLNAKGWFDISDEKYTVPTGTPVDLTKLNYPVHAYSSIQTLTQYEYFDNLRTKKYVRAVTYKVKEDGVKILVNRVKLTDPTRGYDGYDYDIMPISKTPFTYKCIGVDRVIYRNAPLTQPEKTNYDMYNSEFTLQSKTVNGKKIYAMPPIGGLISHVYFKDKTFKESVNNWPEMYVTEDNRLLQENSSIWAGAYVALYGDLEGEITVEGVSNRDGKDKLTMNNRHVKPNEFKYILQARYPELWANSLIRGIPQSDGTIRNKKYLPLPIPNGSKISDPNPITGTNTQGDNVTNVDNLHDGKNSNLPSTVSKPNNPTKTPDTTDTGTSPSAPLPAGHASSMWSIYNPSQSEVDSFGSWMWSSNIFEQIKKLFSDPMQAIIGIHKVFGTPVVGGRRSIKVGYIDSNVTSNYVSSQYCSVDCGNVNLYEYFGNVFDYSPFTTVNLYLPFVGVVQLDTADVMRSTIGVTYGIDVLTGDCLAKVSVERDGAGGILYSYPGNCAVKYPISSGSYLGIIGLAAGAIGAAATGNMGLLAAGASGGFTKVQHGGSFVGNSGATGPKIPYLIVSRPKTALAVNFNTFEGYPVNYSVKISECRGFIRVKECHLSGINATDDELDMIDQILKDGIIVQS